MEEGLIGEITDPFEAVKWQQVLGGEGFLRKLKDLESKSRAAQELWTEDWTEEKLVSCRSRADP